MNDALVAVILIADVPRALPEHCEVDEDQRAEQRRQPPDADIALALERMGEARQHLGHRKADEQGEQRKDEFEFGHAPDPILFRPDCGLVFQIVSLLRRGELVSNCLTDLRVL